MGDRQTDRQMRWPKHKALILTWCKPNNNRWIKQLQSGTKLAHRQALLLSSSLVVCQTASTHAPSPCIVAMAQNNCMGQHYKIHCMSNRENSVAVCHSYPKVLFPSKCMNGNQLTQVYLVNALQNSTWSCGTDNNMPASIEPWNGSISTSDAQMTYLTRMMETKAPAPRPTDRKNDIVAPASSLFSMLTRLPHKHTHTHSSLLSL